MRIGAPSFSPLGCLAFAEGSISQRKKGRRPPSRTYASSYRAPPAFGRVIAAARPVHACVQCKCKIDLRLPSSVEASTWCRKCPRRTVATTGNVEGGATGKRRRSRRGLRTTPTEERERETGVRGRRGSLETGGPLRCRLPPIISQSALSQSKYYRRLEGG